MGGTERSTLGEASGGHAISEAGQVRSTERSFVPARHTCRKCGARRIDSQLGLEQTPEEYVAALVDVFREVRRVLRSDGTVWLNLGDSYASTPPGNGKGFTPETTGLHGGRNSSRYQQTMDSGAGTKRNTVVAGLKPKDLVGIPWRVAFALQADGWYLRSDIVWSKPNPMPESVTDRPTKSHEYLFLLAKSSRYFFDADAVREPLLSTPDEYLRAGKSVREDHAYGEVAGPPLGPSSFATVPAGRNIRSVWTIATAPYANVRVPRDDDGGSDRIASPDCPVHGDRRRSAPTAGYGEPLDASDPARSPGNGHHPAPTPRDAPVPTAPPRVVDSAPDSSGSPDLAYALTAMPRSTQSRRTDPAPETSPRGTVAAGSSSRTGRTSPDAGSDANDGRTLWSSTAVDFGVDATPTSLVERMPENTTCTCESWEELSHFAVFPPKLVEPCVKAGTSERGVCPECGAPWERVVAKATRFEGGSGKAGRTAEHVNGNGKWRNGGDAGNANLKLGPVVDSETTGWRPTCRHEAEPVPGVVLDPFAGTGTVGMVAQSLSRRAVLIDLNPDYLRQCLERNRDMPLGLAVG